MDSQDSQFPIVTGPRAPAERELILSVLQRHLPFETDLVGPGVLSDVVRGAQFKSTDDGHRMELTVVLGTLSSVATLVHAGILLTAWASRTLRPGLSDTERRDMVRTELRRQLGSDPRVTDLLDTKSELIESILADIHERVRSSDA